MKGRKNFVTLTHSQRKEFDMINWKEPALHYLFQNSRILDNFNLNYTVVKNMYRKICKLSMVNSYYHIEILLINFKIYITGNK